MAKLSIDLNQFKKIKADKNTTTLRHMKNNHEIRLAHSALSPDVKKQIDGLPMMADGGPVDNSYDAQSAQPAPSTSDYAPNEQNERIGAGKLNDAIQGYQDNLRAQKGMGPSEPVASDTAAAPDQDDANVAAFRQATGQPKEGSSEDVDSDDSPPKWTGSAGHQDINGNDVGPGLAWNGEDNTPSSSGQLTQMQQQIPSGGPMPSSAPSTLDQELAQNKLDLQKNVQDLTDNNAKVENLLKNKQLDPNRLYHNKDLGSKIGTGIALALSGIGQGLMHSNTNEASKFMDDQINRDVDAQKNDQSNNINLWKMHNEGLHSQMAATLMTKNNLLTDAKVKLEEQMGNMPGPMAAQRAQLLQSQINNEIAMNNMKLGLFQTAVNPATQGTEAAHVARLNQLQMFAPELYKDAESKYIPSVGVARVPITPQDRDALRSSKALNDRLDEANDFMQNGGDSMGSWSGENRAKAQGLRSDITTRLGELVDLKRFTPEEAKFYESRIPDFGGVRVPGVNKDMGLMNDLRTSLAQKNKSFMDQLGVTPFVKSQAPDSQKAVMWARSNPNDPRAQRILQVNGVR